MKRFKDFQNTVSTLCETCNHLDYDFEITKNTVSHEWQMRIFGKTILPQCIFEDIPKSLHFLVSSMNDKYYILIW